MTAFGWNDSGGGTTVPRLAAKELARRGWDVTVFHAATAADRVAHAVRAASSPSEDGVRLIGVHNRPHGLWDLGNPLRELDDPPITAAFAAALDRVRPDVVHFHNLHNLGAALIDEAAARGLPSLLLHPQLLADLPARLPADGHRRDLRRPRRRRRDCAACVGSSRRPTATSGAWQSIRARVSARRHRLPRRLRRRAPHAARRRTTRPRCSTSCARRCPHDGEIWERLGRDRAPGRAGEQLTVAFLGSAYPHKGPQLLVEAAQRTRPQLRVLIHGEVARARSPTQLRALDARGVVELCGAFAPSELARAARRRRRRRRCRRCGGTARRWRPPSAWPRACRCSCRGSAAWPRRSRDGVDGLLFDGARRRRPGALPRPPRRRAGPARAPAGRRSRPPRAVRRLRRRARGLLRRRAARARRGRAGRRASPSRWQGDHGLHDEPVDHQRRRSRAAARTASSASSATGARAATRRCRTPPTSRCATSGRPT